LSELTLSAADEARLLLTRLNDTRTLYPRELTLGQLFEAQVGRAPDATAVMCGDRYLSYADLNATANRVSAYLRAQGIAKGSRVGVCLPTSVDLPVCMLAILKAGATYVPLDPADPPLRRADVIRASGTTAVIGQRLERTAVADVPVHLIEIEAALVHADEPSRAAQTVALNSDAFACTIFISGRDDASRVVCISHRNLANLICSMAKRPGVGDRDVVVMTSPLTTDRAAFEMFLPLLTGARLVMPLEKELASGRALLHLLQRTGATIMYGAPHTWSALLDASWIGYPALKILCSATELGPRLVEKLSATGGELWSLYGGPETGIWSATRLIQPKTVSSSLGEPIANTALYVFESSLRIAPVGVVGKVYVGGDGLPERARAAAVGGESGAKLYPTGSLGRLQANGQIEYLGRADDRFAHRGRIIDPNEIEAILLRHPGVAEAAVVPLEDPGGDGAIAAFVIAGGAGPGAETLISDLQRTLTDTLPRYLVPSSIEVCDSLPHSVSGAVDRNALQSAQGRSHRNTAHQQPSGEIEERLAALWAAMLGANSVAADDNFFELGGHSLLAARMLAQVEREFGRRIKLATLFLAPTLHDFAKILAQTDLREFDFRQVVKIQPHGSKRPLIVVNNTGIYYGLAKNLGPEQPVYSLQLFDPSVRDSALPNSLEEIASGYVGLIRRVQPQGPYDLMGWCVAGALAFEIARQLAAEKQEISHLFLIDSWLPGYFRRLPRLRGFFAMYSLRAQLIVADWRRVLASEKSIGAFISQRTLFKRLGRLINRGGSDAGAVDHDTRATPETYDQWLLAYLQRMTDGYTPKPYDGALTLLRSRLEPTGWFFREDAGWGEFARAGVDVQFVDGNHFTMFQDPGSHQMAGHVAAALGEPSQPQPPAG
jgi:acyl-CoA synthetase (AMP-forming)/AMP-acid ligase II/thioesterase domain-containing protein